MAKFDLAPSAWTQIIASGGQNDQMVGIALGEALVFLGVPDATKTPVKLGGNSGRELLVPAGVAVSAMPLSPRVLINTGDFGGLAPSAPPGLRIVGTNSRQGGQSYVLSGSQTAFNYRTPHRMGGLVTELRLLFSNWGSAAGAAGELLNPNPITHSKVAVEVDGAASSVPVTFSGGRTVTIAGNELKQSDPIPAAALGFPGGIPRDTLIWVRGKGTMPVTGATVYCGTFASFVGATNARSYSYDPANEVDSVDAVGNLAAITGQTQRQYAPGPVILGRFAAKGVPSGIILGDSIAESSADTINPSPVVDGAGYFSRATENGSAAQTIAMLHLTKPSDVASGWVNQRTMRSQYFQYANFAVDELGVNDIGTAMSANGQPDTLYANLQALWADLRSKGVEKVYRTNYLPRTSGAWTASDGSDQTSIQWYDDTRDAMDTRFAAALAAGLINGIVDVRTPAALSGNSKKWTAPGGTADGLHPSSATHIAQTAPVRALYTSVTVAN